MKKQSNSYLPNGGYTLTNGSNYMLDGFQYDTEYNGGVLEKARLPEAKGLASLPSGILPNDTPKASILPSHVDEEGGIYLGDFIKESSFQYIPIVDHSWLAQETQANLEGVRNKKDVYEQMENSFYEDSALKELSEMWDESTNGLGLVPNKNREYIKVVNPTNKPQAGLPGDDYREKIEKAMRRSAYGEPLKVVLADLKQDLGNKYTDEVGNRIASDHGLHGKVYIREEAFKGLFNGTWDKQIKARCASAKYIIPASKDCVFDYHQGRKVVSNINWKSAFEHYAPKLKTIGIKLGSGSNYQARLKQAFLSQAPAPVQPQTWYEYEEDLTKRYTTEEAQEQLEDFVPVVETYESLEEKEARLLEAKVQKTADQIMRAGLINKREAEEILNSRFSNAKKMNLLFRFASTKEIKANYQGSGIGVITMSTKIAQDFSNVKLDTPEYRELKQRIANADIKIQKLIASGLITEKKANKIACGCQSSEPEAKVEAILASIANNNMVKASYEGQRWEVLNQIKTYQNDFKDLERVISSRIKQASSLPLTQKEKAMIEINQALENKLARLAQSNYINANDLENITGGVKSPKEKLAKVVSYLENQLIKIGEYTQAEFKENVKLSNKTAQDSILSQKILNKQSAKKTLENVQHLINAGILNKEQAYKLASQGKTPQEMYLSVLHGSKKLYENTVYTAKNLLADTKNTFENFDAKEQRLAKLNEKAIDTKIAKLVQANMITQKEVNSIHHSNPNKKLAMVLDYISKKHIASSKDYEDTQYTQHIASTQKNTRLASAESVESWVRQKMAEGAVGKDLDVMLQTRFASEVLDHYADMITKVRTAHEGLSGQAYVDAGAYEKVGCEQGALQHRSNMIPAVLEMSKCSTCVFKNADGYCQKYNKPVIASVAQLGIENPKKYQKESIRLANGSDADRTASLFVNNYDEDEFSLTSNDEIELEVDTSKTPDKLADVLFGGFEF